MRIKKKEKKKRKVGKIAAVLAIVIALILTGVGFVMSLNVRDMNNTVSIVMDELSKSGNLVEKDHDYKQIKLYGFMKFNVKQYDLEEVGNVCVMTVNMFGLMQMGTVVVTPYEKDVPLFSTDFMYILRNRKYLLEMDNVMLDTGEAYQAKVAEGQALIDSYDQFEYFPAEPSWLDDVQDILARKMSKDTNGLDEMTAQITKFYVDWVKNAPELDDAGKAAKKAEAVKYANNLIEKGGLSTDVFKKALGEDFTRSFFQKVFFGTER